MPPRQLHKRFALPAAYVQHSPRCRLRRRVHKPKCRRRHRNTHRRLSKQTSYGTSSPTSEPGARTARPTRRAAPCPRMCHPVLRLLRLLMPPSAGRERHHHEDTAVRPSPWASCSTRSTPPAPSARRRAVRPVSAPGHESRLHLLPTHSHTLTPYTSPTPPLAPAAPAPAPRRPQQRPPCSLRQICSAASCTECITSKLRSELHIY